MKNSLEWNVTDIMHNKPSSCSVNQKWHTGLLDKLTFESIEKAIQEKAFYSSLYGQKEIIDQIVFKTQKNKISTKIFIRHY
jgi:hypothetical protein